MYRDLHHQNEDAQLQANIHYVACPLESQIEDLFM